MACPICEKRKEKRFCPARGDRICAVCCGSEREITIDCPSDCVHLIESRRHEFERRDYDWSKLPFRERQVAPGFAREHASLLDALTLVICDFAAEHRATVDQDVVAATSSLAEAFVTLDKGIYYEKRPASLLQAGLYDAMKAAISKLQKDEAVQAGFPKSRDGDLRDALIVLTQLGARHDNGRPRSRAYLDMLRREIRPKIAPQSEASRIIIP